MLHLNSSVEPSIGCGSARTHCSDRDGRSNVNLHNGSCWQERIHQQTETVFGYIDDLNGRPLEGKRAECLHRPVFTALKTACGSLFAALASWLRLAHLSEPGEKAVDQPIPADCAVVYVRLDAGRMFRVQFLADI